MLPWGLRTGAHGARAGLGGGKGRDDRVIGREEGHRRPPSSLAGGPPLPGTTRVTCKEEVTLSGELASEGEAPRTTSTASVYA